MSEVAMLHVAFGSAEEAERIARAVIDERLAACVNLLGPCGSIYRWRGEVTTGTEYRALFKTAPVRARRLAERIAELHSYDLPSIESWIATASEDMAHWAAQETQ